MPKNKANTLKRFLSWKSAYYNSTEQCSVEFLNSEIVIASTITGKVETTAYHVRYLIQTTLAWQVKNFTIDYTLNNKQRSIKVIHQNDNWYVDGQLRDEFKNCVDIDISLTPFTNSLPVNRLILQQDKPQRIKVLYVDVLDNKLRVAQQQYTKKSSGEYNFQNVPNDFEADIRVDAAGFVVNYPGLFERIE